MSIQVPSDLEPFVEHCIATGAYGSHADVVRAAFELLKERERLSHEISIGFKQIEAGEYTEYGPDSILRFMENVREQSQRLRAAEAP